MFDRTNTTGYTDAELAALNAELTERLAGLEPGSDEYEQAEKAFHDEVARRPVNEDARIYAEAAAKNGEVEFQGKSYALLGEAELTDRVFPGWFGDAAAGETYTTEYSAPAIGEDGEEYVVRWRFEVVKDEEPDADTLDWTRPHEVIPA